MGARVTLYELHAHLPRDRSGYGELRLVNRRGETIAGPWMCRGKSDSQRAKRAGNPTRDPLLPYGDHPTGTWELTHYVARHERADPEEAFAKYGPGFLLLKGVEGAAEEAMARRSAIGIHAGRDLPDGSLMVTYGCLRTVPEAVLVCAVEWARGTLRTYRVREGA